MAYWSGSIQLGLEWTEELDSLGPENAGSVDTGGRRELHHATQCAGRSLEKNAWSRVLPTAWRPLMRATQGRRGGRAPRQGWSQCCCPAAESQGPVVQEAGAHSGRQPHGLWEAPTEHQGGGGPREPRPEAVLPGIRGCWSWRTAKNPGSLGLSSQTGGRLEGDGPASCVGVLGARAHPAFL